MIEEMLDSLEKQTGVAKDVLMNMAARKQKVIAGVSLEGAIQMIARDFGVNSFGDKKQMNMAGIVSGMKNVGVTGRIFNISRIVEFKRSDGTPGRVVNVYIGDFSGFAKLALWNDQVKLVEEEDIEMGDVIQITNAFAKENQFGDIELSLGKFGNVQIVEADMPSIDDFKKRIVSSPQRAEICNATQGLFEISGEVVTVFRGNFIFNTCSLCGSSFVENKCPEHGDAEAMPAMIISLVVDDGTGDMRVVFFRELAEKFAGITTTEISAMDREKRYEIISKNLLGRAIVISGRVKKNKIYDRLEMMANNFKDLDTREEARRLVAAVEAKLDTTTAEGGNNI
jgi:replication factor A1